MGNINIGFHATTDEISQKIKIAMSQYKLIAVVVKLWPEFEFKIIDKLSFEIKDENLNSARFIFLCKEVPSQLSKNYNEFLAQNVENLVLQIGEITDDNMKESTIGTRAANSENIRLWRKVISLFKK